MTGRHKRPRLKPADSRDDSGPSADSIEEELLASYLAGTLASDQRARVARYLATSPEAREVLSMASAAMRAERRTK